jgi:hypothetical protein
VFVGRHNRHYYRVGDVWDIERAIRRGEVSLGAKPPMSYPET